MRALLYGALACALMIMFGDGVAYAHGDEDHAVPKRPPAALQVPQTFDASMARRLPDGSLWLPKPVQRRLGILTQLAHAQTHAMALELNGRVLADPNAAGRVQAGQPGRIEGGPHGLPLVGQTVVKGQVLAYLRPTAGSLERGSQQAALADLDAQTVLAERKLTRYEQLDGAVPQKDIEAARVERDALRKRRGAVAASLGAPEILVAPVSGTLLASNVALGQVVDARELLFDIADLSRLMVEVLVVDPAQARGLGSASAALPNVLNGSNGSNGTLTLQFAGASRQLRDQAMPVLFRVKHADGAVAIGQTLKVTATTAQTIKGVAVPRAALGRNTGGDTLVWLHVAAERFVARIVTVESLDAATVVVTDGLHEGERLVTAGASLLAQVR